MTQADRKQAFLEFTAIIQRERKPVKCLVKDCDLPTFADIHCGGLPVVYACKKHLRQVQAHMLTLHRERLEKQIEEWEERWAGNAEKVATDFICPLCLRHSKTSDKFPKCCGHYMIESEDYVSSDLEAAREYELSLLPPHERERILRASRKNKQDNKA